MEIKIANYKIVVDSVPKTLLSTNYFNIVNDLFGINGQNFPTLKSIYLKTVPKLLFPIKLEQRAEILYAELNDTVFVSSPFFNLSFDINTRNGEVELKELKPQFFYLLKAIKFVLSITAINDGNLPFHCSAVLKDNKAYIFTGQSGSGKTTASVLLSLDKYQILNDELNIININNSDITVHSTPFTTEAKLKVCNNLNGKLEKIYFLKKAETNYLSDSIMITFNDFLESLYTFPTTKTIADKMLMTTETLFKRITSKQLYFINNDSFIEFFKRIQK